MQLIILVTGGSGFLGRAIVAELLEENSPILPKEIRIIDRQPYSGITDDKIKFIDGDICNYDIVSKACEGVNIVIHTAAIVDWGTKSKDEVYASNVTGTENIIKACKEHKVKILLYTSTLDVIYRSKNQVNIDESLSYPEKHPNMYGQSKNIAEKMVLSENCQALKTCSLRPSDIYGEGDPYHIPALIKMAKSGFYIRVGNGRSKCQHVYVRNMAYAHLLALQSMLKDNGNQTNISGNTYLITDAPGTNFFIFFDKFVVGAGYKMWPKNLWLPRWFAWVLGAISEFIAILVRPIKYYNPNLSRFAVNYISTDFTFSSKKAKNDFGYEPKYSEQVAYERTVNYFRNTKQYV